MVPTDSEISQLSSNSSLQQIISWLRLTCIIQLQVFCIYNSALRGMSLNKIMYYLFVYVGFTIRNKSVLESSVTDCITNMKRCQEHTSTWSNSISKCLVGIIKFNRSVSWFYNAVYYKWVIMINSFLHLVNSEVLIWECRGKLENSKNRVSYNYDVWVCQYEIGIDYF
jgi:hypothetical protein